MKARLLPTPEMIEAGAQIIGRRWRLCSLGVAETIAKEVFREMLDRAPSRKSARTKRDK